MGPAEPPNLEWLGIVRVVFIDLCCAADFAGPRHEYSEPDGQVGEDSYLMLVSSDRISPAALHLFSTEVVETGATVLRMATLRPLVRRKLTSWSYETTARARLRNELSGRQERTADLSCASPLILHVDRDASLTASVTTVAGIGVLVERMERLDFTASAAGFFSVPQRLHRLFLSHSLSYSS